MKSLSVIQMIGLPIDKFINKELYKNYKIITSKKSIKILEIRCLILSKRSITENLAPISLKILPNNYCSIYSLH